MYTLTYHDKSDSGKVCMTTRPTRYDTRKPKAYLVCLSYYVNSMAWLNLWRGTLVIKKPQMRVSRYSGFSLTAN